MPTIVEDMLDYVVESSNFRKKETVGSIFPMFAEIFNKKWLKADVVERISRKLIDKVDALESKEHF